MSGTQGLRAHALSLLKKAAAATQQAQILLQRPDEPLTSVQQQFEARSKTEWSFGMRFAAAIIAKALKSRLVGCAKPCRVLDLTLVGHSSVDRHPVCRLVTPLGQESGIG